MIKIIKLPLYLSYFVSHAILVLIVAITYIPFKIKHLLKPNLNKRPYMYSVYLLNKGSNLIERIYKRII